MLETLSGSTRLFPVIGDPIAQVKSPFGMTQAFESLGRNAICIPMQIDSSRFQTTAESLKSVKNIDGVIITVPHKFSAFNICDKMSERAAFLKSVNAIRRLPDGTWYGDMFDGLGLVSACKSNGCIFQGKNALLIGAGGAGTAIAHAIAEAGVAHLQVADLDAQRAHALVTRLRDRGFSVQAGSSEPYGQDIIVNATPMGMRIDDAIPVPVGNLRSDMFVADVVTKPEVTPLIAAAREIGCRTSNGVAMFEKVRDLMVEFLLSTAGGA